MSEKKNIVIPKQWIDLWRKEGTLYTSISLLDFLSKEFEKGEVEPDVYHKQLRSNVKTALSARMELEGVGFQFEKWLKAKKIEDTYPIGLAKLRRAEGGVASGTEQIEKSTAIDYTVMKKLPQKAGDFVASSIELTDYLRLGEIATIGRILPIIENLNSIIQDLTTLTPDVFPKNYDMKEEMEQWIKKLMKEKDNPGKLLDEKTIEQLEMASVRWLNDFRRRMTNL